MKVERETLELSKSNILVRTCDVEIPSEAQKFLFSSSKRLSYAQSKEENRIGGRQVFVSLCLFSLKFGMQALLHWAASDPILWRNENFIQRKCLQTGVELMSSTIEEEILALISVDIGPPPPVLSCILRSSGNRAFEFDVTACTQRFADIGVYVWHVDAKVGGFSSDTNVFYLLCPHLLKTYC